MSIPEEFLNVHYFENSAEGLDDFLSVRGVPWLIRKLIQGKMKNTQFLLKLHGEGYSYLTGNTTQNLQHNFKLDEDFTAVSYDGKKHKIVFSVEGDKLKEKHTNLEREVGDDVFVWFFKDGVLTCECEASGKDGKKAVWRRKFAKKI